MQSNSTKSDLSTYKSTHNLSLSQTRIPGRNPRSGNFTYRAAQGRRRLTVAQHGAGHLLTGLFAGGGVHEEVLDEHLGIAGAGSRMPGRWSRIGRRSTTKPGSPATICSSPHITDSRHWARNTYHLRCRLRSSPPSWSGFRERQ